MAFFSQSVGVERGEWRVQGNHGGKISFEFCCNFAVEGFVVL